MSSHSDLSAACAELAPTGVLRAAINLANPLLVTDPAGPEGVAPALAAHVAERLGVALRLVLYPSPGPLMEGLTDDAWDVAFVGATPARAEHVYFTAPYVELPARYLAHDASPLSRAADADAEGTTVVALGRTAYAMWLTDNLASARLVLADDAAEARALFQGEPAALLAGLASALIEDVRQMPGTRILEGQFTAVRQAIGTPRVNRAGAAFLEALVLDAKLTGLVARLTQEFAVDESLSVSAALVPFVLGTYTMDSAYAGATAAHGQGVVLGELDAATGALSTGPIAPAPNPAFVVVDRPRGRVWAVTETIGPGELLTFALADDGLHQLARQPTGAVGPGHVTVDPERDVAYVCHFHGGLVTVVRLDPERGDPVDQLIKLPAHARGHDRARDVSRPHCSLLLDRDTLVVTDFGRSIVSLYEVTCGDSVGLRLRDALALRAGAAPRHIAHRPGDDVFYVSNEGDASITVFRRTTNDEEQRLAVVQTVPSPGLGRAVSLPSEIAVHPSADVVYMANRRDNSVSVFARDPATGDLYQREAVDVLGEWPRHFALTPDGRLMVVGNQDSDSLISFFVARDGALTRTGHSCETSSPANVRF